MSRAPAHAAVDRELSIAEMLADPIVRAVMARDGVTDRDVEHLVNAVRAQKVAPQAGQKQPRGQGTDTTDPAR